MISVRRFLSQKPWIISVAILLSIGLWLLSGASDSENALQHEEEQQSAPLAKVIVTNFKSQPTHRSVSLYGRTAPDRQANLGAEVSGTVDKLLVRKGQRVTEGQALIRLNKADRELQLKRAEALLRVRDKEHKAAKSLRERGLQGEVALSQAEAALIEAKASVRNLELALENTLINAPFDGIVETLHVEKGDYLGIGDPVATVVDLDPLVINADASERHIQKIHTGQKAHITLLNGFSTDGKIRYQASVASAQTNTFAIEVEIPNPGMKMTAGISADVELSLDKQSAIKVTPSMLALDESGNLGIKTLGNNDRVAFVPIAIVKVEPDGIWLSGVGDQVDVITVGQGFVREGDKVIPVHQTENE
ncbi:efflux RND transporter periplasmic adaptor subunit [Photobacterium chitinilyticum]|uniref:Efflux RND transporter periplasmic adaptor subunit n=1 Tax=Photobacterium chitinilyticum TaxID=2485123 RepID=A0A3S3UP84_9GAMM|nr:efflux RND transporter periplasmic adaptor subunit [Photobacterium chitinilyticum]RWX57056.1 efflux RND transporter periplasmic adaptor subunit [Photobacterium chitinilyticum]